MTIRDENDVDHGKSLFDFEVRQDFSTVKIHGNTFTTNFMHPMNTPPGNPTETEIDKLNAELGEYEEAIKKQKHIRWLAGVEITRIEKSRTATLKAIETITKGPES